MINTQKLKTSIEFAKNIKTTGAFRQTSEKVEQEITKHINSDHIQTVVEFGTGHGNITRVILEKMHPQSELYSFEVNEEFCEHVAQQLSDARLHIVNAGAETIDAHIDNPVDVIISSIPLTLFPKELTMDILHKAYDKLQEGGHMSQILYTRFHRKKFDKVFDHLHIKRIINVPMEYIHHGGKG